MNKIKSQPTSPLTVSGLTKFYGESRGIEDVSFEVRAGEVFGFLGPNGAGKSTTIRIVLGFLNPTSGSISLFGNPPSTMALRDIGYLSGDFSAYENLTGRSFLRYLGSLSRSVEWEYVEELVRRLDASLDRPIHTLSKGNKQKIGIIQAMMHQPKLLVLDEPTSGLDPLIKQEFYNLLDEARTNYETTVFVSSHDLTEVKKICDRAGFIRDGKLIGVEDIDDISHLNARQFIVSLASKPSNTLLAKLKSLSDFDVVGNTLTCTVTGPIREFLSAASLLDVSDFREQSLSLEELFMHYYQKGDV